VLLRVFGTGEGAALVGAARQWQEVTLTFTHDRVLSESGNPNPFLDLRLVVDFFHESGKTVSVPGYFAADGNAAETGATSGSSWRVHFVPDLAGLWYWAASFRSGNRVAIATDPTAGQPASFDGSSGSFQAESTDPGAPGFLSKGRLEYTGRHLLR